MRHDSAYYRKFRFNQLAGTMKNLSLEKILLHLLFFFLLVLPLVGIKARLLISLFFLCITP